MKKFIKSVKHTIGQFIWATKVQARFICEMLKNVPNGWGEAVGPKAKFVGIAVCYLMAICLLPLQILWTCAMSVMSLFSRRVKQTIWMMAVTNEARNYAAAA